MNAICLPPPRRPGWRLVAGSGVLAVLVAGLVGCNPGPTRYQVAGKVTFAGKAVPLGRIYFDPDLSKGGEGVLLQGTAEIKDGVYDTARTGVGTSGGAILVRIEAFDGVSTDPERPAGNPLFPSYQVAVELPRQNTTGKDFDIPAGAVGPQPGTPGYTGP